MCGVERPQPRRDSGGDLLDQLVAVAFVEGRLEGQEFVEGQAERKDVAAGVGVAVELFGRHVAERAEDVAGVGQVLLIGGLGEAEVGDPDTAMSVEEQVARFDVAVDDALLVGVLEGLGGLEADAGDALPVDGAGAGLAGLVRVVQGGRMRRNREACRKAGRRPCREK